MNVRYAENINKKYWQYSWQSLCHRNWFIIL